MRAVAELDDGGRPVEFLFKTLWIPCEFPVDNPPPGLWKSCAIRSARGAPLTRETTRALCIVFYV